MDIKNYVSKEFNFHSKVKIPNNILGLFPLFYKEILDWCGKYYSQAPTVPLAIGLQYLWFNNCVNIDCEMVYFREFSHKKIFFYVRYLRLKWEYKIMGKYFTAA